jgi:hypothetical protein
MTTKAGKIARVLQLREQGLSHAAIGAEVGMSRGWVRNTLLATQGDAGLSPFDADVARVAREYADDLGRVNDREIAKASGTTKRIVKAARESLGRKPATRHQAQPFEHLLGVVSDREIARQYGVDHRTVSAARRRLGKDSAGTRRKHPRSKYLGGYGSRGELAWSLHEKGLSWSEVADEGQFADAATAQSAAAHYERGRMRV